MITRTRYQRHEGAYRMPICLWITSAMTIIPAAFRPTVPLLFLATGATIIALTFGRKQ